MPDYLTPSAAAEQIGITRQAVNAAILRGDLKTDGKHGDVHRITPAAAREYRKRREQRRSNNRDTLADAEAPEGEKG